MIEYALRLARQGVPVFPLAPRSKVPLAGGKGLHDATTDEKRIRAWWGREPNANIGARTGIIFDAIDIDGFPGLDAVLSKREWKQDPLTGPMVRTPRGWHVLVKPQGTGNRAGIVRNVDYRGEGGYVVAPGSVNDEGKRYVWINPDLSDLQDPPQWFRDLLTPKTPQRPPTVLTGQGDAYGRAALRRELETVRQAKEGTRNHQLNASAFSLGQLIGAGKLEQEQTMNALVEAGMDTGLTLKECIATVRSGVNAGMEQPREIRSL